MSTLSCGSQTQLANSSGGLTIDMHAVSLVLVDAISKFRLKNPRVLFALVVTITCQLDAFQMDAVNFQRANETRSSWTHPK